MKRKAYLPADDAGKMMWLNNFSSKIGSYAATLGLNPGEVSDIVADAAQFAAWVNAILSYRDYLQQLTAAKNALRDGPLGSSPLVLVSPPTITMPVPAVAAGIFIRIAKFVQRIKNYPTYTDAIGQDLGIIGAEDTTDPSAAKPILNFRLQAGQPLLVWLKGEMDALEIEVDRNGTGFVALAIDTEPDYLDTAALPAAGVSAVWKYRAIYRLHDERVGSWSDTLMVPVMGD